MVANMALLRTKTESYAKFFEDLKNRNMVAVTGKDKYSE